MYTFAHIHMKSWNQEYLHINTKSVASAVLCTVMQETRCESIFVIRVNVLVSKV